MKKIKSMYVLLLFVFVSIVATFFIFYYLFSRNSESSALQQLTSSHLSNRANLEDFFMDIESSLLMVDRVPITRELFNNECIPSEQTCHEFLDYFMILDGAEEAITGFNFFSSSGELLLSTAPNSNVPLFLKSFLGTPLDEGSPLFLPVKTYQSSSYHQIYISDFFEEDGTSKMFGVLIVYGEQGDIRGFVVADISVNTLDTIFTSTNLIKNSQETYIVGSDLVMRTNSRFSDSPTRLSQIVKTEGTDYCFREKDGFARHELFTQNYNNVEVLMIYEYIPRFDWCLVSEIDKKEITQVRNILIKILFLLATLFIGTLLLFFEKIIHNTNFLKKKQQDLEHALFEKEQFKKALDAASDNIFILDKDVRVMYMNLATSSHTGFMPKESLGKKIQSLWWSKIDTQVLDDILTHTFSEKKSGSWEITSVKQSGSIQESEIFVTPVVHENEFLFALVIEHDIQKRKELDSLKDEFIAIASHELRTPMTIIRGYVSLLRDRVLGDINQKQEETLQKIDTSSAKLIELVTDMLDMSKLEKQEQQDIKKEYFDVKDVIGEVSDGFTVLLAKKNITYNTFYDTYTKIDSDPTLLKQVLVNLIGNAVKFTEDGGSISVHVLSAENDAHIRFEVIDTGIGIPEVYRSMIFKKFSQVENYLTKKNEGTGLGLPICKKIINLLGGIIDFKNNPEKGSIFYFEIPRD